MADPVNPLMIQFLDWIASRPRSYAEAMDAWRTSCPRLSIWEDALISGFIQIYRGGPVPQDEVTLTPLGRVTLDWSQGRDPSQ